MCLIPIPQSSEDLLTSQTGMLDSQWLDSSLQNIHEERMWPDEMLLPFQPVILTFSHLFYHVNVPMVSLWPAFHAPCSWYLTTWPSSYLAALVWAMACSG